MGMSQKTDLPKTFISYAWSNQPIAKQLQSDLHHAGVEVFVDYENIAGGDSLPERISTALDWCNTLILLWSSAAAQSYYVQQEWTSAFHMQKRIIPCALDATQLPALLRGRLYLHFSEYRSGYVQLCRTLGVAPVGRSTPTAPASPKIVPPPQNVSLTESISVLNAANPPLNISLRHFPNDSLSEIEVWVMLKRYDFYCAEYAWSKTYCNPQGKGLTNDFEKQHNGLIVFDRATGLMWQHSGSQDWMIYADVEKYICALNDQRFAGYADWRLPTLEEVMSLMMPKRHGDLHIDLVFDQTQKLIWTADKESVGSAWVVNFSSGYCLIHPVDSSDYFVRAVRVGQSTI